MFCLLCKMFNGISFYIVNSIIRIILQYVLRWIYYQITFFFSSSTQPAASSVLIYISACLFWRPFILTPVYIGARLFWRPFVDVLVLVWHSFILVPVCFGSSFVLALDNFGAHYFCPVYFGSPFILVPVLFDARLFSYSFTLASVHFDARSF